MDRTRMSSRGQVVIPRRIRQALNLKEGTELLVYEEEGRILLEPMKSFSEALRGLGKEVWQGIDPTDYVRRERDAWGER